MAPMPIEELARELRRLYLRLGGDRTDTTVATWSRQSPEEWGANLDRFDRLLVAACAAVGVDAPSLGGDDRLTGPERGTLLEALGRAGIDVRRG